MRLRSDVVPGLDQHQPPMFLVHAGMSCNGPPGTSASL